MKRSTGTALAALILCMSAWAPTAQADLIAYWGLDDVKDGITRDRAGTADGRVKGKVVPVSGRWGGALEFSGEGSGIDCGKAPAFSVTKAVTVAAWVRVDEFDKPEQSIVMKGLRAWRLRRRANTSSIEFACTGVRVNNGDYVFSSRDIQDGKWHHVVGGYSGTEMFLYIDGVLERRERASGTIATNDQPVFLGACSEGAGREWRGLIDEALLFDRALTDQEIVHLYRLGADFFLSPDLVQTVHAMEKVRSLLQGNRPQETIGPVQAHITECEQRKQRCPRESVFRYDAVISELYYLAGQAGQMMKSAPEDVRRSLRQSLLLSLDGPECVPVLSGLYAAGSPDEYAQCVSQSLSAHAAEVPRVLPCLVRDFLLRNDWTAFEVFLNVLFESRENRTLYARAVANELDGHWGWLNRFRVYCWDKPELRDCGIAVCDRLARRKIQAGRFSQAILLYREVLQQCDSPQVQAVYTLRICKCLFENGQLPQAIEQAERLMKTGGSSGSSVAVQAGLIKVKSHVQLGQLAEAAKTYEILAEEYPNTAESRTANLIIGHARMAAGQQGEARRILNSLAANSRDEPIAQKARLCLSRMDSPEMGR